MAGMETLVALIMGGAPAECSVAWVAGMLLANNCFFVPAGLVLLIYLCDRLARPRNVSILWDCLQRGLEESCTQYSFLQLPAERFALLPPNCWQLALCGIGFLGVRSLRRSTSWEEGLEMGTWCRFPTVSKRAPRQSLGICLFFLVAALSVSAASNLLIPGCS